MTSVKGLETNSERSVEVRPVRVVKVVQRDTHTAPSRSAWKARKNGACSNACLQRDRHCPMSMWCPRELTLRTTVLHHLYQAEWHTLLHPIHCSAPLISSHYTWIRICFLVIKRVNNAGTSPRKKKKSLIYKNSIQTMHAFQHSAA